MSKLAIKQKNRNRRHNRVRAKVSGTVEIPRLAVFRSNCFLYAQLIDDKNGVTLGAVDTKNIKEDTAVKRAKSAGLEIASSAKKSGIEKVVFDRGGFMFAGSIKEFAEGAREGGLIF